MRKTTTTNAKKSMMVAGIIATAVLIANSTSQRALAVNRFWDSGGGVDEDWGTATNWDGDTLPVAADRALFNDGGTAQLTDARPIGAFTIGDGGADNGTLQIQAGGNLTFGTSASNYVGNSGTGILDVFGGALTTTGHLRLGETSTGDGIVNQSGGTVSVGLLQMVRNNGGAAEYNLSGATSVLNVSTDVFVGNFGTATFNQMGGEFNVADDVTLAANPNGKGTYNMSGGTLTIGPAGANRDLRIGESTANDNVFNHTGGDVFADRLIMSRNTGTKSTYKLSGSGTLTLTEGGDAAQIGWAGLALFEQSGGVFDTQGADMLLTVGSSAANATYDLKGGVLDLGGGDITKGNAGATAAFNFTGGTLKDVGTFGFSLVQMDTDGTSILSPGAGIGTTAITGDYTLDGGVLEIEMASAGSFDVLSASSSATLNDTLKIVSLGGFQPELGFLFDVVTAPSISLATSFQLDQSMAGLPYNLAFVANIVPGGLGQVLQLSLVPVPEPATVVIGLLGVLGMWYAGTRRRNVSSQKTVAR